MIAIIYQLDGKMNSYHVKNNALAISNTTINISGLVSVLQINTHITKLSLGHDKLTMLKVNCVSYG
ncbi:MAG: hypothetical protein LBE46_04235 [Wolbachia pipientis]|nr:hypothetical protein [Wolbachia pipientis]